MRAATSPSSGTSYGLALVCRVWRVARATVYRHRIPADRGPRWRPGPVGADAGWRPARAHPRRARCQSLPRRGSSQGVGAVAFAGLRTSRHRVLRLMREHALLAPARTGSPRGPRNHDGTIIPETVDTMWGTDMTTA